MRLSLMRCWSAANAANQTDNEYTHCVELGFGFFDPRVSHSAVATRRRRGCLRAFRGLWGAAHHRRRLCVPYAAGRGFWYNNFFRNDVKRVAGVAAVRVADRIRGVHAHFTHEDNPHAAHKNRLAVHHTVAQRA